MKKILALCGGVLLLVGCDKQRDLYDTSNTLLHIEGSWTRSLNQENMLDATVLLYKDGEIKKEFLSRPNGVTTRVTRGRYDVVTFNGVMESENVTNLDHVHFRGTDRLESFEAYAEEGRPNSRLSRAEGEYIASNEMELLTFVHTGVDVDGESLYYLKYRNGKNGYPEIVDHVEGKVEVVPRAMSYRFRVIITNLANPRSARSATAALRGFQGSVFVPRNGEPPRTGFPATHHLNLTSPSGRRIVTDGEGLETGALQSPPFVTFGPPLDVDPTGRYTFDPVFVLVDGTEYRLDRPIDVSDQVRQAIVRMQEHHNADTATDLSLDENLFTIVIDDRITLPGHIGGGNGSSMVDVEPWEDDEEAIIWVGRN